MGSGINVSICINASSLVLLRERLGEMLAVLSEDRTSMTLSTPPICGSGTPSSGPTPCATTPSLCPPWHAQIVNTSAARGSVQLLQLSLKRVLQTPSG